MSAPRALVRGVAHVGVRLLGAGMLGAAIGGFARRAEGALDVARDVATRPVWDAAGGLLAALPVQDAQLRLAIAGAVTVGAALAITVAARGRGAVAPAAMDAAPVAARPAARAASRDDAAAFLRQVEAAARAVDRLGVEAPRRTHPGAAQRLVDRTRARLTDARSALASALAATRRPEPSAVAPERAVPAHAAHAAARGAARRPALVSPLAESGATRAEIARRTGLSRDAVALSLNLAARQG